MDKLQLRGQNLGRVFNISNGRVDAMHFLCYRVKLPNLKLKTEPKQLLHYPSLDITLPHQTEGVLVFGFGSLKVGACSAQKNLLFSYKTDYLIVEFPLVNTSQLLRNLTQILQSTLVPFLN